MRHQPENPERLGVRGRPAGDQPGVVSNRRSGIDESVPAPSFCVIVQLPLGGAFGTAGVVRRVPVRQRHDRDGIKMASFERVGSSGDPPHEIGAIPLPDGVKDAGSRATCGVGGGDGAPHNPVCHLHERGSGNCEFGHGFSSAVHARSAIATILARPPRVRDAPQEPVQFDDGRRPTGPAQRRPRETAWVLRVIATP